MQHRDIRTGQLKNPDLQSPETQYPTFRTTPSFNCEIQNHLFCDFPLCVMILNSTHTYIYIYILYILLIYMYIYMYVYIYIYIYTHHNTWYRPRLRGPEGEAPALPGRLIAIMVIHKMIMIMNK